MGDDKRTNRRVGSLNLSYVCVDEQGTKVREGLGRSLNISETGLLLETTFYITPNSTLVMQVAVADDLIDLKGKVVHCEKNVSGRYQTGVEFTEKEDIAPGVLRRLVQAMRG